MLLNKKLFPIFSFQSRLGIEDLIDELFENFPISASDAFLVEIVNFARLVVLHVNWLPVEGEFSRKVQQVEEGRLKILICACNHFLEVILNAVV